MIGNNYKKLVLKMKYCTKVDLWSADNDYFIRSRSAIWNIIANETDFASELREV